MKPFPIAFAVVVLLVLWTQRRRVGWVLRIAAVAVAAGFAVYGAGLIELPNFEELLLDVGDTFGKWAYLLVGGLAFLETGAFIGLLAPGETAVIAGGVFAGQGNLNVFVLLGLVWFAAVAGDSVSFWLGRKLGRGFLVRHGPRVKITEERLKTVEAFFERRGGLTILIGRFVGLVAPGETAVIAGGVIAGQDNIDIFVLLPLVWLCCIGGDCVSYWLGRRLGRGFMLKHGPRVKITEARLEKVEAFFARRGGLTILIGRFLGLIRALAPFVAGASRMPFSKFLPYDIVGCGLWASTFTLLGYFSWRNIDRAAEIASTGAFVIGTVVGVSVGAWLALRFLRTREQRSVARAWVRAHLRPSRAPSSGT